MSFLRCAQMPTRCVVLKSVVVGVGLSIASCWAPAVQAQSGSYTSASQRQLNTLRAQSVGTGFTAAAVNQQALQTAFTSIPETLRSSGRPSAGFGVGASAPMAVPQNKTSRAAGAKLVRRNR